MIVMKSKNNTPLTPEEIRRIFPPAKKPPRTNLDRIHMMSAEEIAPMLLGRCIRNDARYGKSLAYTSPADSYGIAYPSIDTALQHTVEWLKSESKDMEAQRTCHTI